MISSGVEISRAIDDVFAYVAELDRHGEWQAAVISARTEPPGPIRVGTRNIEVRKVPGGPREFTAEIVQYEPPRLIVAQGVGGGPVVPRIGVTLEPLDGGRRTRVTMELDLVGHGIGKLFAVFARRHARVQMPRDLAQLKAILER